MDVQDAKHKDHKSNNLLYEKYFDSLGLLSIIELFNMLDFDSIFFILIY